MPKHAKLQKYEYTDVVCEVINEVLSYPLSQRLKCQFQTNENLELSELEVLACL